jgi:protein gp37
MIYVGREHKSNSSAFEPLLGPLRDLDLRGINGVIVGGESGPGARRLDPDWV